jgi:hypothetical protein
MNEKLLWDTDENLSDEWGFQNLSKIIIDLFNIYIF